MIDWKTTAKNWAKVLSAVLLLVILFLLARNLSIVGARLNALENRPAQVIVKEVQVVVTPSVTPKLAPKALQKAASTSAK